MKTLVIILALAALVVVLLLQLGSGDSGGEGLFLEGTARAVTETALPPTELAPRESLAPAVAAREDAAPEAATEREATFERFRDRLETGARFFGRAVAAENNTPIAHAEVRTGVDTGTWGLPRRALELELDGEPEATTDADGRFQLALPTDHSRIATVSAAGRAPARVRLDDEHATPERALDVRLSRAATLSGVVIDAGTSSEPLSVELESSARWLMPSPGLDLGGGRDIAWQAEVQSGGSFSFECLPPDVPLRVRVLEGKKTALRLPAPLTLEAGEQREVEWRVGAGSIVHGTVLDENSHPVPDVELWLMPASEIFGASLLSHLDPTRRETSDSRGMFSFADLAPGDWGIGVAPEQERVGAVVCVTTVLDTPPLEILVRAPTGGFISGRVLDPDGNGVEQAVITTNGREGGDWSSAHSEADGEFRVGPLLPGEYRIFAAMFGPQALADSEQLEVRTGDSEVVLQLTRGGHASGRVVDRQTGEPVEAHVSMHAVGSRGYSLTTSREEFDFGGLDPGTYHLIARTESGQVGSLCNVHVGADSRVENLELEVDRAGRARVRYQGPLESALLFVEWNDVEFDHYELLRGVEKILILPPGEVVVHLKGLDRTSTQLPPPVVFEREARIVSTPGELREVVFEIE